MSKFQVKNDEVSSELSNASLMHPRKKVLKRNLSKVAVVALTSAFLLGNVNASQAADTTPMDSNPGYAADFSWKGLNWEKRFWSGGPNVNGQWDRNNVSNPDANGYVKLSLSNPTGSAPVGAEFQSTRRGFGYGTYSTTVEKNISALQKEVVWGCLFTYDPDAEPGHNEIDLCEASAWGGGAAYGESWPVEQGHGYWFDATKPAGQGNNTTNFTAPSNAILTHKMVWEPGKITFETYAGEGYSGTLLKRTVLEGSTVPVPAQERIHFNLWVTGGGGGTPQQVKPESVTIRDFKFTPAGATVAPAPAPTASSTVAPVPTPTPTVSTTAPAPAPTTPTATTSPSPTASPAPTKTTKKSSTKSTTKASSTTVSTTTTTIKSQSISLLKALSVKSSPIKVTHTKVKANNGYNAKLKWTGAKGVWAKVSVNGVTKTVLNTGTYTVPLKNKTANSISVSDSVNSSSVLKVQV